MLDVIRAQGAFYPHVVDVHLSVLPIKSLKTLLTMPERWPNIFEFEGHHLVAIDSPTSGKSSPVFVWWVHLDLVVPEAGVYEAEGFVAYPCFYWLIDPRE